MPKQILNNLTDGTYLLIEEQSDGIFLYHESTDGKRFGDTWHKTVEDAKHQARWQFSDLITEWRENGGVIKTRKDLDGAYKEAKIIWIGGIIFIILLVSLIIYLFGDFSLGI